METEIKCAVCKRHPHEINEYVVAAKEWKLAPEQYVRSQEGTFNLENGLFYCTKCYIKIGMPLGKALEQEEMTTYYHLKNLTWNSNETAFVTAKKDLYDEDWKTESVRRAGPMKQGNIGKLLTPCFNAYGEFVLVEEVSTGVKRYLRPEDLSPL